MECRSLLKRLLSFSFLFSALSMGIPSTPAWAQSDVNRVLWQIGFDDALSESQRSQVQSAVIQTLSRAKERHFVGHKSLTQKLKKEGLNFPECFDEGMPCSDGGAFVLDVYNVDAYANAHFSQDGDEWRVDIEVYRNLSATAVKVQQSGRVLPDLMQRLIGSLFELESSIDITTNTPDVEVYINQKLIGTAPLQMKIAAGSQSIVFKKSGYVSASWDFEAEKGKVYSKTVELTPEETQLTVLTSAQDAEIDIDGEFWGNANDTHAILPGTHQIEVRSATHHPYAQEYKVYPGTPQTIQIASRPLSRSPYEVRQEGIQKYRLAATVGYHLASHTLNMPDDSKFKSGFVEKVYFNGISLAFGYEAKYWGISFFRLDVGGASASREVELEDGDMAKSKDAVFVGFYPAQIRAHYPFWVMQAEAAFALGFSYTQLSVESPNEGAFDLKQNAFSIQFSLGLKYFLSEESFVMLAYDLQYDAIDDAKVRNGMTLAIGFQFPVWQRENSLDMGEDLEPLQSETEDDASTLESDASEDAVIEIDDEGVDLEALDIDDEGVDLESLP